MNENDFNKGIQDLKHIHLTKNEKHMILARVMKAPVISPYAPMRSVWNILNAHKRFAAVLASALALLTTGGALAYAAEGTVPGDLLYPVKIHVTEPIVGALAITPAAKAQWDATKAVRRINEAEILANQNKLTPQYQQEIEQNFNANVSSFDKNIRSVASTTPKISTIANSFNESLREHANVLGKIGFEKSDGEQRTVNQIQQTVLKTYQDHVYGGGAYDQNQTRNASTTRNMHTDEDHALPKPPQKGPTDAKLNFGEHGI